MKRLLSLVVVGLLGGCAHYTGWSPTVDPYGDPNAYRIQQDRAECMQLARQAAGDLATESVSGALVGGAVGAATGAVIGALTGAPGRGAAWGAAVGGMGSGIARGLTADQRYQRAYIRCMQGRGHRVLN
ncbi:MAG TPA: hypothetical protein ENI90_06130 [Methylothermaceae bacterium]|nr:hypothetical protein [Methylothermaceae bacterium]